MLNRLCCLGLIIILALTSSFSYAMNDEAMIEEQPVVEFVDVLEGEWYYDAVMLMAEKGIINGYDDKTFRPMSPVLREEFAKMMVLALNLDVKASSSSFVDVADGYWASPWIEAAKTYLTVYTRQGEYLYKPKEVAAREDMAVALVKAKGLEVTDEMLSSLDGYEDANLVSTKLKKYMAAAVYHEVMVGYVEDGKKYLKPKSTLSRAEASSLIISVIKEDEKVVFDDEKVTFEEGQFPLTAVKTENGYMLSWDYSGDIEINAYKVVASKSNEKPSYPDDGYTAYVDKNNYDLKVGSSYVNGDFDQFMPDEYYYVAITGLTDGESIISDVIKIKMPIIDLKDLIKPTVRVEETDEGILVSWDKIEHSNLNGYKVVASKSIENPEYPMNGYAKWITDKNTTQYLIRPGASYSGGDIGGSFKSGEKYYFNITAVYNDRNIAGDGVQAKMIGEVTPPVTTEERTPVVTARVVDGKVVVSWSEINRSGLNGYKIVVSKNNPNPIYSQDGYAHWITNLDTKEKQLSPNSSYNGGDIGGKLLAGETYYFSVTAVYNDTKIAGNAVQLKMPN